MKDRIKLTESQLKKVISKIIKEELINELDDKTIQNALLKTRYHDRMGQHDRISKHHADKFFKQFIGKKLEVGIITRVDLDIRDKRMEYGIHKPTEKDYDKSFIITIRKEDGKDIKCTYSEQGDNLSLDGIAVASDPMSRRDAMLLSKMVSTYNPETKYKIDQLHRNFRLSNNMREAKLDSLIEQHIRKELINELDDRTMQNALLKTGRDDNRQGQYNRMSKNYSDRFFDKFTGKELLGFTIMRVELNTSDGNYGGGKFNKSFTIYDSHDKRRVYYDYLTDKVDIHDNEYNKVSRRDAILLCKIVSGYNPDTIYQINNINRLFKIIENMHY